MKLQKTDPEFTERFRHFAFDEVVKEENQQLDAPTRYLAILAALIGCGGVDAFREMLPAALENGVRGPWQYLPLGGAYAYPLVFDWNRDCFLLAADENGWQLFWSPEFPAQWDPVAHFDLPAGLIAPVAVPGRESMGILFSEPDEKHPEQTRVHLYELTRDEADPQKFLLQPDEGFAFTHRAFLPAHLNAGPVFAMDGRPVRVCAQGEYLQFYLAEGDVLRPLCAATPHNVRAELPAGQKTESIHAYARDEQYECLAVMLTR